MTLCLLASCSPRFSEFTFVQMTDPQIGFRDTTPGFVKSDSLFNRAAEAVNILNPKCVVITGDLVNDAYDTSPCLMVGTMEVVRFWVIIMFLESSKAAIKTIIATIGTVPR